MYHVSVLVQLQKHMLDIFECHFQIGIINKDKLLWINNFLITIDAIFTGRILLLHQLSHCEIQVSESTQKCHLNCTGEMETVCEYKLVLVDVQGLIYFEAIQLPHIIHPACQVKVQKQICYQ